jgi:hypothetical protein
MKIKICLVIFCILALSLTLNGQTAQPQRVYSDRMAAFHETLIRLDEVVPNTAVMTYHTGITEVFMVALLSAGIEIDNKLLGPEEAKELKVEDFPGYVQATYKLGDVRITARHTPLLVGRDTNWKDGASVYSIQTEPVVPIVIRCRGQNTFANTTELIPGFPRDEEKYLNKNNVIEIKDNCAIFKDPNVPFYTVICSSEGDFSKSNSTEDPFADIRFPGGNAQVLISFDIDKQRAVNLCKIDIPEKIKAVNNYYNELLRSRIETPEIVLNEAFRSAIYNLEYNYQKPYGWVECINHWMPIWHQQHTAAAEWLEQEDRSRLAIESQAVRIKPENQIPNILNDGQGIITFGGTNQFWAWELRHYIKSTNDVNFAKEMIPYLDRVLKGTIDRDDPDNNGLFAWGLQIGNQEDFIATPHDGTVPTTEAINMMLTRAEMADIVGDIETANYWRNRTRKSQVNLKQNLWLDDLGRFGYFYDATGMMRPDGAYQAYLYPVLWDIGDELDKYTGLRHLLDRLAGENGEIYCSNNFPAHYMGTWGMQAGCAQQPWGAWGLAKMGMSERAYLPLKQAAEWAMDINHRGSWPEVASEPCPAYFSPPAGLYISSMIEAIFGLKSDIPNNTIEISPAFPDNWPKASLNLPKYQAAFEHNGNKIIYNIKTEYNLEQKVRWKLPVCEVKSFKINGKKIDYRIAAGVGCIELQADLSAAKENTIEIEYKPIKYKLISPKSAAQGDAIKVELEGAYIIKIIDRSGVLSESKCGKNNISAVLTANLLDSYLPFGRLGLLNFSRRTFFIECQSKDIRFWVPVNIAVLPRYEVSGEIKDGNIELLVRNNTFSQYEGNAFLNIQSDFIPISLQLSPRSEKRVSIALSNELEKNLRLGDNSLSIFFNSNDKAEFILSVKNLAADSKAALTPLNLQ